MWNFSQYAFCKQLNCNGLRLKKQPKNKQLFSNFPTSIFKSCWQLRPVSNICLIYYAWIKRWIKTLMQIISSFHWTSFCLIVFLFCRYFCLLRHFEIIRCIVKSLIAIQHIFVAVQLKAPRRVYPYLKQTGYVTKNTCVRVFLMKLQALRPATLLKSVSKAGVLLLI